MSYKNRGHRTDRGLCREIPDGAWESQNLEDSRSYREIPVHGTIVSTALIALDTNFCSGFLIQISHFQSKMRVKYIVPCTGIEKLFIIALSQSSERERDTSKL